MDNVLSTFDAGDLEPYLDGFLQEVNHFLYLFNEFDLRQTFQEFFNPHLVPKQEETEIEVLLVMALGAKYSGLYGDEVHLDWFKDARTKIFPISQCKLSYELPLMRIVVLLSLYCIDASLENSRQFLGISPISQL